MAEMTRNVLRPNAAAETEDYRTAISRIILDIQRDTGETILEIADRIDISTGTLSNALNKRNDLSAVYLRRLGVAYGSHYLNPFAALYGAKHMPLEALDEDALPPLSASVHRLAVAQSPDSPGGPKIVHSELLDMLPDLRAAQRALSHLIARAERIAA